MKKDNQILTAVTYNIRTASFDEADYSDELNNWKYRKQELFKFVDRQKADVICFQEDTKEQLKDLEETFGDRYHVISFDESLVESNTEYNSIFLQRDYEVVDSGYYFISNTPEEKSHIIDSLCIRHLTYVKTIINQQSWCIINVHLDHSKDDTFKEKEAQVFLKIISKYFNDEKNLLILGDFNFTADNNSAHELISTVYLDVSKHFGVREPTHPNWLMHNVYKQIDYIFLSRDTEIQPLRFEILKDTYIRSDGKEMEPSDHFLIKGKFLV